MGGARATVGFGVWTRGGGEREEATRGESVRGTRAAVGSGSMTHDLREMPMNQSERIKQFEDLLTF